MGIRSKSPPLLACSCVVLLLGSLAIASVHHLTEMPMPRYNRYGVLAVLAIVLNSTLHSQSVLLNPTTNQTVVQPTDTTLRVNTQSGIHIVDGVTSWANSVNLAAIPGAAFVAATPSTAPGASIVVDGTTNSSVVASVSGNAITIYALTSTGAQRTISTMVSMFNTLPGFSTPDTGAVTAYTLVNGSNPYGANAATYFSSTTTIASAYYDACVIGGSLEVTALYGGTEAVPLVCPNSVAAIDFRNYSATVPGTLQTGISPGSSFQANIQAQSQGFLAAPYSTAYPSAANIVNGYCVGLGCAPSLPNIFPGLTVFADSGGCGFGPPAAPADPKAPQFSSPLGYVWQMAPDFGGALSNYCNPGDTSIDLLREWAMPYVQPTDSRNPTYVVEIGGNDAVDCVTVTMSGTTQPGTNCVTDFGQAIMSAATWLGIPTNCKVYGQQTVSSLGAAKGVACPPSGPFIYAGSWAADNFTMPSTHYSSGAGSLPQVTIPGIAAQATSGSATAKVYIPTTVPNQNIYCAWRVYMNSYTSFATMTVDSGAGIMLSSQLTYGSLTTTGNGTTDTIFVYPYLVPSIGNHLVTLTTSSGGSTGTSPTNPWTLVWCGVAPQESAVPNPSATVYALVSVAAVTVPPGMPANNEAVFTGTISGGAGSALAGQWFQIEGFNNTVNNNGMS